VAAGRVKAKVKGGLIISIGVDAFMPASHIDIQPPKNLDQYVGQTYDFKVLKINVERQNIVLSRRELIEEQRTSKRRNLLDSIQPGQVRKGVVKNITDFGAFIDLDGMDGLLHITDMSWGRISHPSEMLKQGEEIQVMIIEVNREKERVSLGLKQTTKNPWDEIDRKFPVGAKVHGKVVNLVPYGAFIEIEPGVEGLVHITEMSWTKRITKPSELLKVGQELDAVVLGIQKDEQKISLGLRQLEPNPWDMVRHNYPIGARVRGKVRNMTTYGAFIELEEGIDGMVHVSDMSWTRKVNHPSEVLKKGDEVDAIVLDVDPNAAAHQPRHEAAGRRSVVRHRQPSSRSATSCRAPSPRSPPSAPSWSSRTVSTVSCTSRRSARSASRRSRTCSSPAKWSRPASSRSTATSVAWVCRSRPRTTLRQQLAAETSAYEALNRSAGNDMMNLGDILDEASKKE
jgi:small subunit ribosomal protein S1